MITLLGKDGIKQQTKLLFEKARGAMALGDGWKSFVKENGLKTGDSFTLKLIWEDTTPVLSLCPAKHSIDKRGGYSETNQKKSLPIEPSSCKKISKDESIKGDNSKEKNSREENKSMEREKTHLRGRDSTPSSQKQFVTFKITPSSFTNCRLVSLSINSCFRVLVFSLVLLLILSHNREGIYILYFQIFFRFFQCNL